LGGRFINASGALRGEGVNVRLEFNVTPSFRGDAKHRTRNLEIPRCAIAHLRSGSADHPGMTASGFLIGLALRAPRNDGSQLKWLFEN
jgi:hypothetical protein